MTIQGLLGLCFWQIKDETYEVFEIFVRLVQKKLNTEVINIRSDHG